MKMLSERGFNIHMFPMIPKRGKIPKNGRFIENVIVRKDRQGKVVFKATSDSKWNKRCYIFMDWLSSKIRSNFNLKILTVNPGLGIVKRLDDPRLQDMYLLNRPDLIHEIIIGVNNPSSAQGSLGNVYRYSLAVLYKEVAKDLKWQKNDVKMIIKMISDCKFITEYKMQTIKPNTTKTGQFIKSYKSYDFESIFNVEINDREAEINFNTGYGICFLHNIFTGAYEKIDDNDDLYKLSENTQFIYRQTFFTYGILPKVYLRMDRVFRFLNITTENSTNKKKLFKKIINELSTVNRIQLKRKVNDECYEFSLGIKKKENKIIPLTPELKRQLQEFQDDWDSNKERNGFF